MIILLIFAFLSGIITVLSPCILPVLPILLAVSIGEGKYRPLGIICGVIVSFTFFTLSLTVIVHATGISPNVLRYCAIGLLILFGLTLIFPRLEQLFSQLTGGIANLGTQIESQSARLGGGFWSGFMVGSALGLIWAPCAGPILATIVTLVATSSITLGTVLLTLAYSAGTALPMFLIMYGSNKIISSTMSLGAYTQLIRTLFGIIMIAGALAILFHADVALQQFTLNYFPSLSIENNPTVRNEIEKFKQQATGIPLLSAAPHVGGAAPDFVGIQEWINTKPLSPATLRGTVFLVDFWTYSCINCVRTLPYLKKWYTDYHDKGFTIVGIHTPEFEFEKDPANVKSAVKRFGIEYPVALDNEYKTWQNYHNSYWPAHYLADQTGIIKEIHFGEGNYTETENEIRKLLGLEPITQGKQEVVRARQTPETYLGASRGRSYSNTIKPNQISDYSYSGALGQDQVGLTGQWYVAPEFIQSNSDSARLSINFTANRVYLVMASAQSKPVTLFLDDNPLPAEFAGKDVTDTNTLIVKESRMYDLIDLKKNNGNHLLTLQVPKDVQLYAFTFGSGVQ